MLRLGMIMIAITSLLSASSSATTLILTLNGTYGGSLDYTSGQIETFTTPRTFIATVTLPIKTYSGSSGSSDVFTFYDASGLTIKSPFLAAVEPDPVGNGLADAPNAGTVTAEIQALRGAVDTRLQFTQAIYHSSNNENWRYAASVIFDGVQTGPGYDTPYVLTPDKMVDFLTTQIGRNVEFSQWWNLSTTAPDGSLAYSDGISWVRTAATLASVQFVSEVPEVDTWLMFVSGFGLIGALMRRQQRVAVRFS